MTRILPESAGARRFFLLGLLSITISLLLLLAANRWQTNRQVELDAELALLMEQAGVVPLELGIPEDTALVALGEALFFDKILSGNQDISCATCHHPLLASGDGRALPAGTGSIGSGPERVRGAGRDIIPRNAPEIFNRGAPQWSTMFWDGRVAAELYAEGLKTPAGELLPLGISGPLAAQALFPPTSRAEMRGQSGDVTTLGYDNELAALADDDLIQMWSLLLARVTSIPEYQRLLRAAYPNVPEAEISIAHLANAIAAYEVAAFSFDDSPWDRYVAGDRAALSQEQKAGARLFFGEAGCAACHNGPLLTDQSYHNIGTPPLGPGKSANGLDEGRFLVTGDGADLFAFRTPPLRNVALTAPYLHSGAYETLQAVIRHHVDPAGSLRAFDGSHLSDELQATLVDDAVVVHIVDAIDPQIEVVPDLSDHQVRQLIAFLEALTSPSAVDLSALVPDAVPSGLPVAD